MIFRSHPFTFPGSLYDWIPHHVGNPPQVVRHIYGTGMMTFNTMTSKAMTSDARKRVDRFCHSAGPRPSLGGSDRKPGFPRRDSGDIAVATSETGVHTTHGGDGDLTCQPLLPF